MRRAWSLTDISQLHDSVRLALAARLTPGEPVLVIVRGAYNQAVVGTDRRVLVFKNGGADGETVGARVSAIEYPHILEITVDTGWLTGSVTIQSSDIEAIEGDMDSFPNVLPIGSQQFPQARAGVAQLRKLMEEAPATGSGPFCGQCGSPVALAARFCGACGAEQRTL